MEYKMQVITQNSITEEALDTFFSHLSEQLPPVFDRKTISNKLGSILSVKTLSNADSNGTGPKIKIKLGKRVVYERDDFIEWLKTKVR